MAKARATSKRPHTHPRVGCCGFRLSRAKYIQQFDCVEVQQTFYDPPSVTTLVKWREEVPDDFEFSLKAWQLITHDGDSPTYRRMRRELPDSALTECGSFRPTDTVREAMRATIECAEALRAKHVVFQCPARFKPTDRNIDNLRTFFSASRPKHLIYCWEPRGKWPPPLIKELCDSLDLVHVVDPFVAEPVTHGEYYFRVHGRRGRGFRFTPSQLDELAITVRMLGNVSVYFNHLAMVEDGLAFKELLATGTLRAAM